MTRKLSFLRMHKSQFFYKSWTHTQQGKKPKFKTSASDLFCTSPSFCSIYIQKVVQYLCERACSSRYKQPLSRGSPHILLGVTKGHKLLHRAKNAASSTAKKSKFRIRCLERARLLATMWVIICLSCKEKKQSGTREICYPTKRN